MTTVSRDIDAGLNRVLSAEEEKHQRWLAELRLTYINGVRVLASRPSDTPMPPHMGNIIDKIGLTEADALRHASLIREVASLSAVGRRHQQVHDALAAAKEVARQANEAVTAAEAAVSKLDLRELAASKKRIDEVVATNKELFPPDATD
jgi:hypothetical protein